MVWRNGGGFKVQATVGYSSQYSSTPQTYKCTCTCSAYNLNTSRHVLVNIFCITQNLAINLGVPSGSTF